MLDTDKAKRAKVHIAATRAAAKSAAAAIARGEHVTLADAKALEAAGCWLRRNAVK